VYISNTVPLQRQPKLTCVVVKRLAVQICYTVTGQVQILKINKTKRPVALSSLYCCVEGQDISVT